MFYKIFKILFTAIPMLAFLGFSASQKGNNEQKVIVKNNKIVVNNTQESNYNYATLKSGVKPQTNDDDDDNDILYGRFRKR